MTVVLDTSFLFTLTDRSDRHHQRVLTIAQSTNETLVLPVVVLPEICYLVASRLGHQTRRQFVAKLTPEAFQVETVTVQFKESPVGQSTRAAKNVQFKCITAYQCSKR